MTVYTELSDVVCNEVNTHRNLGASSMHLAPKPSVLGRSMLACQGVYYCHTGHSCDSVFVNLCLPSLKKTCMPGLCLGNAGGVCKFGSVAVHDPQQFSKELTLESREAARLLWCCMHLRQQPRHVVCT